MADRFKGMLSLMLPNLIHNPLTEFRHSRRSKQKTWTAYCGKAILHRRTAFCDWAFFCRIAAYPLVWNKALHGFLYKDKVPLDSVGSTERALQREWITMHERLAK